MKGVFLILLFPTVLWAGGYPEQPFVSWIASSYDELFQGKVTQYDKEQALLEFVKRYEHYITKLNEQKKLGELRTTHYMAQYMTARKYLIDSFFEVGLREENYEHWDINRAMTKGTYLEIQVLAHMERSTFWFGGTLEEQAARSVEILKEVINHPAFLQYDSRSERGFHINLLGVLARECEKVDPLESLDYYHQYFTTGIAYNVFLSKGFYKKWQHYKALSAQLNQSIQNQSKLDQAIQDYYDHWDDHKGRTEYEQMLIDDTYLEEVDAILENNQKKMMLIKPESGEGPCLSHDAIGQTARKGTAAPEMKFFFEDCMGEALTKETPFEMSLDYGAMSQTPWFSVSTETQGFDYQTPVVVTVTFDNTELDIGSYEGNVTITTPKGSTSVKIQLGIWD